VSRLNQDFRYSYIRIKRLCESPEGVHLFGKEGLKIEQIEPSRYNVNTFNTRLGDFYSFGEFSTHSEGMEILSCLNGEARKMKEAVDALAAIVNDYGFNVIRKKTLFCQADMKDGWHHPFWVKNIGGKYLAIFDNVVAEGFHLESELKKLSEELRTEMEKKKLRILLK
jgi:hypothetical protein